MAIIALLFLTAVVGVPAEAQEEGVEKKLTFGAEAMHRGKADEAEKFFRKVIQLAPELADGYLDLGLAQLKQGKVAEAVESLETALQRNPSPRSFHVPRHCLFLDESSGPGSRSPAAGN